MTAFVCNRCGATLPPVPAGRHVGADVFLEHEAVCPHVGAELERLREENRDLRARFEELEARCR